MKRDPAFAHLPTAELRDWQKVLLKNLAKARPNSWEWKFNTGQLDEVNRALAARR